MWILGSELTVELFEAPRDLTLDEVTLLIKVGVDEVDELLGVQLVVVDHVVQSVRCDLFQLSSHLLPDGLLHFNRVTAQRLTDLHVQIVHELELEIVHVPAHHGVAIAESAQ